MMESPYTTPQWNIHCIFCGWYRIEDRSKGAPPFNLEDSVMQLLAHLDGVHTQAWKDFLDIRKLWLHLTEDDR